METPITKEQFALAATGSKIIDGNGREWIFTDEPVSNKKSFVERFLKNPNNEIEELTYTNMFGENNIIDEELAVIIELNCPKVQLVS